MEEHDLKKVVDRLIRLNASITPSATKVSPGTDAWKLEQEILKGLPKTKGQLGVYLARLVDVATSRQVGPSTNGMDTNTTRAFVERVFLKESGFSDMPLEECMTTVMRMMAGAPKPHQEKQTPLLLPPSSIVPTKKATRGRPPNRSKAPKVKIDASAIGLKIRMVLGIIGDATLLPGEIAAKALEKPYQDLLKGKRHGESPFTQMQIYGILRNCIARGLLERNSNGAYSVSPEYKSQAYKV